MQAVGNPQVKCTSCTSELSSSVLAQKSTASFLPPLVYITLTSFLRIQEMLSFTKSPVSTKEKRTTSLSSFVTFCIAFNSAIKNRCYVLCSCYKGFRNACIKGVYGEVFPPVIIKALLPKRTLTSWCPGFS